MRRRTGALLGLWALVALVAAYCGPMAPDDDAVYECSTQPRVFFNPKTGEASYVVDHYFQSTPCPKVPIK